MNLSEVKDSEAYRVITVDEGTIGKDRLAEMGFLPGTIIQRIGQAPAGDPVVFLIRGLRLAMRKRDARDITVEPA
jgi:Fe2+ transport system protein FeoA